MARKRRQLRTRPTKPRTAAWGARPGRSRAAPRPRRAPAALTVEVNAAVVVLVTVLHEGFELLVCHVLPRGPEDLSQLLRIDVAVCVPSGRRDRVGLRAGEAPPHPAPAPPRGEPKRPDAGLAQLRAFSAPRPPAHLSKMRKHSASSSSLFPFASSFIWRTIMTKNSSKSMVPLPEGAGG